MTLSAIHRQMFGVIEFAMHKPAVGNFRPGNDWNGIASRLDFMTDGAPGIKRATIRGQLFRAKKNLAFQIFPRAEVLPQSSQLGPDKNFQSALLRDSFSTPQVCILNFQAAQKGADGFGISVRQSQVGIVFVELERMTFSAIVFERNSLVIGAGGIGTVTIDTIQGAAIFRANRIAEVNTVIELQRIRIFQILQVDLEFRVSARKALKDAGVAARGPGRFKKELSVVRPKFKGLGWKRLCFLIGFVHDIQVAVARVAVRAVGWTERSAAEMFTMTRGAGKIMNDIWLVKIMVRMATLAGLIEPRHELFFRRKKFCQFECAGMSRECGPGPTGRREAGGAMAIGTLGGRMLGGKFSRRNKMQTRRAVKCDEQSRDCQRHDA